MNDLLSVGQWQGFYCFGPEYGDVVAGKEAEFRLFIEYYENGTFTGKCIDWEGMGANGEVSEVRGFIKDDLISFTKSYPEYYVIDEWGNTSTEPGEGYTVEYEGRFEPTTDSFFGTWEIVVGVEHGNDLSIEEITTGTWRMERQIDQSNNK